ncbi:MAG: error-prone DNA polymerase [Pseudomonadota bacterium]|nr:error-prone DNA polymerase [Pseudomonadota bacterium]
MAVNHHSPVPPPAGFAELHCLSNFSFLRGASHPEELIQQAHQLGYQALALTDECSLAGVVRAHLATREHPLKLIFGSEFRLDCGLKCVLLATDRASYGRLCAFISKGRRSATKGSYRLSRKDLETSDLQGCLALWLPGPGEALHREADGEWLRGLFPEALWIGVELFLSGTDHAQLSRLTQLGNQLRVPLVACNDVHMHRRSRQPLQDCLTAIRLNQPVSSLGHRLYPNAERHLRSLPALAQIYPTDLLQESLRVAERCHFRLDELRYEYPPELVPDGHSPIHWLHHLTQQGAEQRWPQGVPPSVKRQIDHELALIKELGYEPFFLTVHDLVRFARARGILCQGRGSAANSAVCYCLGITEVDPARMSLLFERFISRERNEPPDIDVDFEHERREEVIQYIYTKYGRHRAALAATVIAYRGKSAARDLAKALGFAPEQVDRLGRGIDRFSGSKLLPDRLREAGFDPDNPRIVRLLQLMEELRGFPRHLSQHVGGFVIAAEHLDHLVPTENAAMAGRTVIEWDKDDLEALGLLKVDVLALGMLSAVRKALELVSREQGKPFAMQDVPPEDPAVYRMLQQGDSIGVFQIESRAQMSMLPRLKPSNYYDLVVQIAIVRPGPIQGDMVHPYLARRSGAETITYPSPEVQTVLERTLGVPIFQEQVMQLAMVAAGFTPGEADQLRRAMAAWKRKGGLEPFEQRLLQGMRERGYEDDFAERLFRQIRGFGDYGFPESHSASFALLAYVSAWLKCHHPAAFTCALLNSQPMGFYGPSQLVQDAQRHGVEVRPVDVNHSDWDCALEPGPTQGPALRLGLRLVKGLSSAGANALVNARQQRPYDDLTDLVLRSGLDTKDVNSLTAADALRTLSGHRHKAAWEGAGVERPAPLFPRFDFQEATPMLVKPQTGEDMAADYNSLGLSLTAHPLALLRTRLERRRAVSSARLWELANGASARLAGLVVCRQSPSTASGVTFVTLEDEEGTTNVIVWPATGAAQRRALLQAQLLEVTGTVQQEEGVLHLIAGRLTDLSAWLDGLQVNARNFH